MAAAGHFGDVGGHLAPKGYSYSIKGGPPPPRPPREFLESQYETAPPVREPPPRNPRRLVPRTSNHPNSSTHPQHSHHTQTQTQTAGSRETSANLASTQYRRYGGGEEISPPSSPEPGFHGAEPDGGDVSPIDDDVPDVSQLRLGSSRPARAQKPVSYETDPAPQQNRPATNIPMMRRARRKASDAALREAHAHGSQRPSSRQQVHGHAARQEDPRWDPMTGERTSSPHGQPSQVKPAQFAHGLGITNNSSLPPKNQPVPSFGDRVRRIAKKAGGKENDVDPAAGAFTSSRPGWRGPSGRTALVDPVHDNPEVAPLRIPEKNNRRVAAALSASNPKGLFGMGRRGQTPPVSPPPGSETLSGSAPREAPRRMVSPSQQSPSATKPQPLTPQSFPNSPLSPSPMGSDAPSMAAKDLARYGLPNTTVPSPTSPASPMSNPSPHDLNNPAMIRRKPPPTHATHLHHESVSSVYSQQSELPPAPTHKPDATHLAASDPWVQPPSRFSVTTYATSAANTPRESLDEFEHQDRPPLPPFPPGLTESPKDQTQQESVMDRRRPHLDEDGYSSNPPSPIAALDRKAAVGINPVVARVRASTTDRPERPLSSASSINKMLPPAPPEASADEAKDRVGLLNAQLQGLSNRKINITRSIKQMTELMPTDNLMDTAEVRRKREMEKRKVEALKVELAEVQREEYELGLKLHRAYKRLDKEGEFEPSTLWVRRVTG
ncbi:hypothetical protein V8F20_005500 [Naviculisporaceae sp. PSN 640]